MPRKPSKPKTTRRGKNEGSVYRRKDGKWVGQVTVGYHPDTGKPIRKYTYANTREEAAHWIALTLVSETSKAAPSLASELLLKDFLHRWLTTFKTYEVCSRTMELYYSCERLHIVPALGDIPVAELTASRIQTFLYYLQAEKQLSRRTTSLVRSILIQLYDYAVEMSLAPINPVRSTKLPRQPQRDGHLAGPAQLQGAGAGGLDVGAAVVIDGGQRLLGPVLAVGVHQGLDQQPCGGGGLDVSDCHLSGVHWVSQVLQAGGSGQVL